MREENENGEDVDGNEGGEEEQHLENELEWQEGDQTTGLAGRGTPMEIQQGYFERTDTASLGSGWSNSDWREWSDGYWGPDGCWIPYPEEESREDLWDEGKEWKEKKEEKYEKEEGKENEKDEAEEGKENDEKEEDAGNENEKDETEEGKENENDEPKEEEKDPIPTTRRRRSRKSPPSEDGSGLIASPAEKKELPVKWGPIKNLQAALKLFRNSGSEKETPKASREDDSKEEKLSVTWWDQDFIDGIPNMTVAEKIRLVMQFPTLAKLEGWKPPQLPRLAWHSLLDIANLVFNYDVMEPAEIVRHLKGGTVPGSRSASLKYLETLRDMSMDQCTMLYQWLTTFENREKLNVDAPHHVFYSAMLDDKLWTEVVAIHSLIWDWWFESPHTVLMYVQGPNWGSFVDTFKRKEVPPKEVPPKDCILFFPK